MKTEESKLHILQHTLGLDKYGKGSKYRNYFASNSHGDDYETIQQLVTEGLMSFNGKKFDHLYYSVTEKGEEYIKKYSPTPPKKSKSQERYRLWLDYHGYDETFGEWLKNKRYDDYK